MTEPVEAIELYNYLVNDRRCYRYMANTFKSFEWQMANKDFVPEHCEAHLMLTAHMAAREYVREYCKGTKYREIFPLEVRRECAALMVREFMTEKEAGNSWL